MAGTSKNDTPILIIGDHHMKKLKDFEVDSPIIPVSKFVHFTNITWVCSQWATIRSSKKSYFKFRSSAGRPPSIVVLSVGNNDMLKLKNPNCIITNLLRTAKTFYNDGVSVVILCSLVEQKSSLGDYNKNVNIINGVLCSKARKIEWLDYLLMFSKNWFKNDTLHISNKLLIGMVYEKVAKNLRTKLKSRKIKTLIANDKGNKRILKKKSSVNFGTENLDESRKNLFQTEINSLKIKISKLELQKEEHNSECVKIVRTIALLRQYLESLEALNTGRNQQTTSEGCSGQQATQNGQCELNAL